MLKTKYILIAISLVIVCMMVSTKSVQAETSTFPVDEAGIAAYVKLDSDSDQMIKVLTAALNYYHPGKEMKTDPNYVIGTVEVENKSWNNYPHLYIGLDGWMVAYYLKGEESSRIMQWKDYTPGAVNTTTLKDAIDFMCDNIGITYSTEVKYYNFEFPDANKMTLIAEALPHPILDSCLNSFSVTVPGTLYEASYSVYSVFWHGEPREMWLKVDGVEVFSIEEESNQEFYDFYDSDPTVHFEVNKPHFVEFYRFNCKINGEGAATILIYRN